MARSAARNIDALVVLLLCSLLLFGPAAPLAASEVELVVGGVSMNHRFVPVWSSSGFLVPIGLADHLGAEVYRDGDRHVIRYAGEEVTLHAGAPDALTRGGVKTLAESPVLIGEHLYVPLSLIADTLRLRVNWDAGRRVLSLSRWTSLTAFANRLAPVPVAEVQPVAPVPSVLPAEVADVPVETAAPAPVTPAPAVPEVTAPAEATAAAGPSASLQADPPNARVEPAAATLVVAAGPPTAFIVGAPAPLPVQLPVGPPRLAGDEATERWAELARAAGVTLRRSIEAGLERYTLSAENEFTVASALIVDPFRLVVDLHGIDGAAAAPWSVGTELVRQVRARAEGDHLRLVFDLEEGVGHRVEQIAGNEAAIVLQRPLYGAEVESTPLGGTLALAVHGETPYRLTRLTGPDRLVIDLEETTLVNGPFQIDVPVGPVTRVRAAQFAPDVARFVLDLRTPVPVEVEQGGPGLLVRYGEREPEPLAYRVADSRTLQVGVGGVEAEAVSVLPLSHPDRIAIDVRGLKWQGGSFEQYLSEGPAFRLRAARLDDDTVRIVADLRFHVRYDVRKEGARTVITLEQPLLTGRRVAVDAGHGGHDPGALSATQALVESAVNLDIARRLEALLAEAEALPLSTRTEDVYVDLWTRSDLANEYEAEAFVSIHNNAARTENPAASGTETYAQGTSEESLRLGRSVHDSVVSALGTVDRGLRRNPGYIVLNRTKAPAILVEIGFLTHPADEALLAQEWFRQRAAEGIFNGLLKFFHPESRSEGGEAPARETEARWIALSGAPPGGGP